MKKQNLYRLFGTALAVLAVFGIYEFYKARAYRRTLEDTYNRAFFELTDYVDDIDTLLAKGMLASSPGEMAGISQELSVQASAAKSCLAQLPITEVQLDKTEKFLSQVGDYTYALSQNLINKKSISEEEYETLNELGTYAGALNHSLGELSENVYSGQLRFGIGSNVSGKGIVYAADEEPFSAIEKKFGEYPSLIYDGPFSEHIENMKPKMLEKTSEISKNEAVKKFAEFLGADRDKITVSGETENSAIEAYMLSARIGKNNVSAGISKKGGCLIYFLNDRKVRTEKLTVEQAIEKASEFLNGHGYNDMKNSYYEKNNGVATINFAYTQNNVVCYSDLIKVKVALDDGAVVGMEANGYIMNHEKRDIRKPALTKQEAREKVSKNLTVDSVNTALIPKDSKREVLCYEMKGTCLGKNFLVYINADNGNEEDIQLLIESEDGILTI